MKQDILVLATKAFGDKAATLYNHELEKFAELLEPDEAHDINQMAELLGTLKLLLEEAESYVQLTYEASSYYSRGWGYEEKDESANLCRAIEKAREVVASLVAAAERETIAKKFDGPVWSYDYREIAAAIRARGE
jgi:hypothetical protein